MENNYIKELGIEKGDKLSINSEEFNVDFIGNTGNGVLWLVNKINTEIKYIISNIAGLFLINPKFEDLDINTKIEEIRLRDKAITIIENDLIGEGKPYIIVDGQVWYVYDKNFDKLLPHKTDPITNKVSSFKPLNRYFSKDDNYVYYKCYIIGSNHRIYPKLDSFKPIDHTSYGYDNENLFCGFNYVEGADISNGITIISEEYGLILDSSNNIFYGHNKVDIKEPLAFTHSCGDFFFDGVNVYHFYGNFFNITELFNLPKGENIVNIGPKKFKIGGRMFYQDNYFREEEK